MIEKLKVKVKDITPLTKNVLPNRVEEAIVELIIDNHLKEGDKLPSERELAAIFGISRTSLRSGLLEMEKKGLIERKAGSGAFVKKGIQRDSLHLGIKELNYNELIEIKSHMDILAIEKAYANGTESQYQEMLQIANAMIELAKDDIFSLEMDHEFHSRVYDAAGSGSLKQLQINLISALDSYIDDWGDATHENWIKTIPYHKDIVIGFMKRNLGFSLAANKYISNLDLSIMRKEV